eukprot:scaffold132987_cov30-Tisochrysis_lutea.AAC.5
MLGDLLRPWPARWRRPLRVRRLCREASARLPPLFLMRASCVRPQVQAEVTSLAGEPLTRQPPRHAPDGHALPLRYAIAVSSAALAATMSMLSNWTLVCASRSLRAVAALAWSAAARLT